MDKRIEQAGSYPPSDFAKGTNIARAMVHSPLAGMIAYSNEGDQTGVASFTAPDGRLIEVERRGANYSVGPAVREGRPMETIQDSTAPKLDSLDR